MTTSSRGASDGYALPSIASFAKPRCASSDAGCNSSFHEVIDELRDAGDSADRLKHIVRDLKIFSRSADEERCCAVNIKQVLESSLRMAWNEIRHRARLIKDYGDVRLVEANDARLGQVFLNLIVNAVQAIREGNADQNFISVSTMMDAASGCVAVEIRDSGCGIPQEYLPRIFDTFFTTKPVGVGTGLGLSICHRIVTGLGGAIHVDSEVGKGTVFRVLLKPSTLEEEQAAPTAVVAPPSATRRGKVLVIDDEPAIIRALERVLVHEHEVTPTSNAGDARKRILAGERYDVILCDLMMPQMTGMDLHAEFLRVAPEQASRMVFMTGGAFTPGSRAFLDDIPNPCIEKPFDTHHLRSIVNDRVK
jgi:CheY-like chemotaxis protein/two-component sensor histidine kinase